MQKRWPEIALRYALVGLATILTICAVSIALNISQPAEDLRTAFLRQPSNPSPRPITYWLPGPDNNYLNMGLGNVRQGATRGMVWFSPSYMQWGPTEELGQDVVGKWRSNMQDWAPRFAWSRVGIASQRMWGHPIFCGGRQTSEHEWRWYATGWPMLALSGEAARVHEFRWDELHPQAPPTTLSDWTKASGAILLAKDCTKADPRFTAALDKVTVIPLTPIPLGLAGNTAFYAALWFVLIRGRRTAGEIRAWSRRRRDCCEACGYSLVGLSPSRCPECGWGHAMAIAPSQS